MGNFINPFSDVGFKRIFGQEMSKPLLIDFLNNLLEGERYITNLQFLDKEQIPVSNDDRSLIYDIYCETDTGENIIVEMQNRSQTYFKQRTVYYASRAIAAQGERGSEWRYDVKAVYCISFLNFCQSEISNEFRTDVALMDMNSHKLFSDKMRLIYLQLPLFIKDVDECENDFERWIYVLKNMETLNRLPFAAKSAVFKRLAEITDLASLSKQERMMYDDSLRRFRDTIGVMEYAIVNGREEGRAEGLKEGHAEGLKEGHAESLKEGRAEGLKEGRAEGEISGKTDVARKLKLYGMDSTTISQMTGIPVEDIDIL